MGIAKLIAKSAGKSLATTSKNEVGAVKRAAKNMGAAERVDPPRLAGPDAAPVKVSNRAKSLAAGAAVGATVGAAGIAGYESSRKDSKQASAPTKASAATSTKASASAPTKASANSSSSRNSSDGSPATKSFGSAFAAARKDGKAEFTFNGKKYHTRTKEEESKKSSVREGRNNNIDDDARKRALDSIANLNKGGMVKRKC